MLWIVISIICAAISLFRIIDSKDYGSAGAWAIAAVVSLTQWK